MNVKMAHQKIIYQLTDKRIPAASGIGIVGDILERAGFSEQFRDVKLAEKRSRKQIDAGAVMTTFIALLCMGKPDFEYVSELQNDAAYYQNALHLNKGLPSPATLRQRMDEIGTKLRMSLLAFNTDLLRKNRVQPTPLKIGMVPVDMDVTPMDNSKTQKEGIGWTYKKFMGYAPMMAYIGTEGYLVNTELRTGSQHCQNGTPAFLRQTIELCRKITDQPLLFRLDSGNDATDNVGIMLDKGVYYVVKRNLRREDRDEWASNIRSWCKNISSSREGKTVYIGTTFKDIHYTSESGEEKVIRNRIVYEMIERTSTPDGQLLLVPEIDINMFWTNLGDSDEDIIALYHAHGECEQFHSEIKTDMGVERLPSGKFDTNELVLELTVLAYNILRMIGQEAVRQGNAPSKRIVSTINEHKSGAFVKMHKRQLSDHSQKGRLLPTIQGKVKNKRNLFNTNFSIE